MILKCFICKIVKFIQIKHLITGSNYSFKCFTLNLNVCEKKVCNNNTNTKQNICSKKENWKSDVFRKLLQSIYTKIQTFNALKYFKKCFKYKHFHKQKNLTGLGYHKISLAYKSFLLHSVLKSFSVKTRIIQKPIN